MIGIKVQDVHVGKKVYYYSYADKYSNSEAEEAVITSGPMEMCGTLCCFIDIRKSVVALSNLSFECLPKKTLSAKKHQAKERYQKYIHGDGVYDGISFGDFVKYKIYKED